MLHAKGVIITSYTAIVRLKDHLLHQRFHYVILDEGHKIRNPDAQVGSSKLLCIAVYYEGS